MGRFESDDRGDRLRGGGHLLLYFLIRRQIVEAALTSSVPPLRLSYKGALEDVQDMRESLLKAGERTAQRVLLPRLLEQIGSHVVPFRPGRHYPRPHDTQVKNKGREEATPEQTWGW